MGIFDKNDDNFEDKAKEWLGEQKDCPLGLAKLIILCPSSGARHVGPGFIANIAEQDIPFVLSELEAIRDELKRQREESNDRHKIIKTKRKGDDSW